MDKYQQLYEENKAFHEYVDKYSADLKHEITPEEALEHVIVQAYGDQVLQRMADVVQPVVTEVNVGCGGC